MATQLLDTATKHPWSITGLADRLWNGVTESAIRVGWGPAARLAQAALLSAMQRISVGQLTLVATNGDVHTFPRKTKGNVEGPRAEIRVLKDTFWIRLCLMGDLGFAEAYMYGEAECDDLVALFEVFLANKDHLANLDSKLSYLFTLPQKLTSYRFLNTISNSRSNVSAHYDISNDMFKGFLSEDMTYSCAIFENLDGDTKAKRAFPKASPADFPPSPPMSESSSRSESTNDISGTSTNGLLLTTSSRLIHETKPVEDTDALYAAQLRKLDHIIAKLHIPTDRAVRILEIGSGWGSMALRIAEKFPRATIDTLTLSVQQQALAQERIRARGTSFAERITVHLMDYRAMPREWAGTFDRVVSVEMVENVGYQFFDGYWGTLDWALKEREGAGVVQGITIPEARFQRYLGEIDFIRKWIFPGGLLPTVSLLTSTLNTGSKGRLIVDSVSNIGPHYARTLREWRTRFEDKFDSVIKPSLQREYPNVMGGCQGADCPSCGGGGKEARSGGCEVQRRAEEEIDVFRRKWRYYYCYCEVGFTTRTLGDHIITFTREGFQEYGCDVYA